MNARNSTPIDTCLELINGYRAPDIMPGLARTPAADAQIRTIAGFIAGRHAADPAWAEKAATALFDTLAYLRSYGGDHTVDMIDTGRSCYDDADPPTFPATVKRFRVLVMAGASPRELSVRWYRYTDQPTIRRRREATRAADEYAIWAPDEWEGLPRETHYKSITPAVCRREDGTYAREYPAYEIGRAHV